MGNILAQQILAREIDIIDIAIAHNHRNFLMLDDQITRYPCLRVGGITHKRLLQTIQREHKLQRRRRRAERRRDRAEVTS